MEPLVAPASQHLDRLIHELDLLVADARALERELSHEIECVTSEHWASARNLVPGRSSSRPTPRRCSGPRPRAAPCGGW
jgi:hypothetical protein